ncbi:serine/threonine-protein kinase [Actinoallomurus soli]|uniref:serine/threonine-protein kinase n=1 Tax=Actinoallomurus soli TaxID=2952535 RepID=UPI0020934702|nr:serine/threonine protein kinase [Actinoallomurus soli]MCO5972558.1 protein kinase [Actinoallomurus soli]
MVREAQPGQAIGGRYRLDEVLAAGGFGRVWRAWDQLLQVTVAVKEVLLHPALPPAMRAQFLERAEREARNAAKLRDHPHIVTVHDVVIDGDAPWIVMQFVVGHSLEDHVKRYGPLSVNETARLAKALLKALGAAHEAGIIHRDVKPANVMMADNGSILLTDFGIAVARNDRSLTAPGTFVGTMNYLAPERARGLDGQAPSDLFSLGATLYYALERVPPFHRDTTDETLSAIIAEDPPAPERAGRLEPLIMALMRKTPDRRPSVADAFRLLDRSKAAGKSGTSGKNTNGGKTAKTKRLTVPAPARPPAKKPKSAKPPVKEPGPAKPLPKSSTGPAKTSDTPKPQTAPQEQEGSNDSTGWIVALCVAAVVAVLLYHSDRGFSVWATERLNLSSSISSAKAGDCIHYIKRKSTWVKASCWSAATEYKVMTRGIGLSRVSSTSRCDPAWTEVDINVWFFCVTAK